MAVLKNIEVEQNDLVKVRADIENFFLYEGDPDFLDEIESAKRTVYRQIREIERAKNPSKTEEELASYLATIQDEASDTPLFDKVVLLTISNIFLQNNMTELAQSYKELANAIPTNYTIGTDEEEAIDYKPVRLGR